MNSVEAPARAAGRTYDATYYATHCGQSYTRTPVWLEFFGGIADRIIEHVHPKTVLDAGCAIGLLVEALRARGVDAFGLDISEYAISQTTPESRPFCRMGSLTDKLDRRYDLIVCIEVVEHLSPADGALVLDNLCAHTDDILFSSTPLDRDEPTHLNVQEPEIWAELFAQRGFVRDVDFDASAINAWALRLRRSNAESPELVRNYERLIWEKKREALALARGLEASEATRVAEAGRLDAEIKHQRQVIDTLLSSRALRLAAWLRGLVGR